MRRDTVTVPGFSHVVIRFVADNPGMWAMHCHVAWHVEGDIDLTMTPTAVPPLTPYHLLGGMFLSIVERPRDLASMLDGLSIEFKERSAGFCAGTDRSFGSRGEFWAWARHKGGSKRMLRAVGDYDPS